jgi:Fe-S-cluster formation regulator IscX/YfhJ
MNLIIYSFKHLSQSAIGVFSNTVIQNMTNDAQFSSLKLQVDALKLTYEAFNVALAEASKGGKDRVEEKNTRFTQLINHLVEVALYVDLLAKGNEKVITASGYELRKPGKTTEKINKPENLIVKNNEVSGAIDLSWETVNGAVNYAIEHQVRGETEWRNGKYTTRKDTTLNGYEPGNFVDFRIRALGRNGLESEWTAAVGVWVA